MKPVLMCGGVGTKMWPLSRVSHPKHFLPIINGKSLFRINYEIIRKKFVPEDIYVQTNKEQAILAKKEAPDIPVKNYFIEPELRNHGPATLFMAAKLSTLNPQEPFFLVQTDVIREPANKFIEMIEACDYMIKKEKKLITGGFRPEFAVMGVDYLITKGKPQKVRNMNVFKMEKWLGRDNREAVEEYLTQKSIFLHANHYSWTPALLLESAERLTPDWSEAIAAMIKSFGTTKEKAMVKREYHQMSSDPIERITRQELGNGYLVELPFKWLDFGTWESLANFSNIKDKRHGERILIDSKDAYINVPGKKLVAVIGIDNILVVDSGDALLVCPRKQSGRVGEVVEKLRAAERRDLL